MIESQNCSCQNLITSKMTTCVPHLPTLWGTSKLSFEVHIIPDLLQSSLLRSFLHSEDFNSEPSSSSNSSPSMSADSYVTLFSSTFITCDTTQRGQLWRVADFPACNPYKSVPTGRDRYNKSTCTNRAVMNISLAPSGTMATAQSSISKSRTPTKKRIQPLILKENSDLELLFE